MVWVLQGGQRVGGRGGGRGGSQLRPVRNGNNGINNGGVRRVSAEQTVYIPSGEFNHTDTLI